MRAEDTILKKKESDDIINRNSGHTIDVWIALIKKAQAVSSFVKGEENGRRLGIQAVVDYLNKEIATQGTRSAGRPRLKAYLDAVERTILQTLVNALEEWLAASQVENKQDISPEEKLLRAIFGEERGSYPPHSEVDGVTLTHAVSCVLADLTERETRVLRLRFGFGSGQAQTLEEVGYAFDVTRERIRQIEGKALRRLRHPSHSRRLKPYLVELEK